MLSRHIIIGIMLSMASTIVMAGQPVTLSDLHHKLEQDPSTCILFFTPEERQVGLETFHHLYPSRVVPASQTPYPLPELATDWEGFAYQHANQTHDLSDFQNHPALEGVMVLQHGQILLEHYSDRHGEDKVWPSFSVTKSVTNLLIGMAVKQGYIQGVDDLITDYLPQIKGSGYDGVSIMELMQMRSGVAWNEDYADTHSDVAIAGAYNGQQLLNYLKQLDTNPAGKVFNYNTGETNLLGEVLRAAIRNNASEFLSQQLWQPFGMGADGYWRISESHGVENGGCCFGATLRDYARIGLFTLKEGTLPNGEQALPDEWMSRMLAPSPDKPGYGALWWLLDDGAFSAQGIYEQWIVIDPKNDMVIAIQSHAPTPINSDYAQEVKQFVQAVRAQFSLTDSDENR